MKAPFLTIVSRLQKKSHGMSGSELAKAKEVAAQKMREKQAAGTRRPSPPVPNLPPPLQPAILTCILADAKKAEAATAKK